MSIVMEVYNAINSDDRKWMTVKDVHEKIGYNNSTIRKYLTVLTELGFLKCVEMAVISDCHPRDDRKPFKKKTIVKYYMVKE